MDRPRNVKGLLFKIVPVCLVVLLLLIAVFTRLSGCFSLTDNNITQENFETTEENAEFAQFTDDLFKSFVTSDGITLHSFLKNPLNYGISDYEMKLSRYNLEVLDDSFLLCELLKRLLSFDRNNLSKSHQITYDQLKMYLTNRLEYSDLYIFDTCLSTTIGIQIQLPIIFSEYRIDSENDIKEYLTLLSDTDKFFENIVDFERLRCAGGLFMNKDICQKIIEQCETFINEAPAGCLISSFEERLNKLNKLSNDDKEIYIAQNKEIVNEHVIKGYKTLVTGLRELNNSDYTRTEGGLCNFPNGKKYFESLLSKSLGWNKSVDDYNKLLDKYIYANISTISGLLEKNPNLSSQTSDFGYDESTPEDIISDLKKQIASDFPKGPDISYEIKYIEKSLQDYASPAMYFLPQIDNTKNNSIYINPGTKDKSQLYTTLAHEGFPGHMYQTTYFAATNPDLIRYLIQPSGYTEGWATYVEAMSYDYADTDNSDLNTLMKANFSTILCLYGKIDIGVNYYNWTEADVYNFLYNYGFTDRTVIGQIYTSMISEPGNYCKYVLGYIGFLELKEAAQKAQGENFNLKNFHKSILDLGPVPFDMLFERIPKLY